MADIAFVPGELNITTYQGDTMSIGLVFRDSLGNPLDVTGWTFLAHILDTFADDTVVAPVVIDCTVTDGPNGAVTMTLTSPASTPLDGPYVYDLQGTEPGGDVRTYLAGALTVEPEVTRP